MTKFERTTLRLPKLADFIQQFCHTGPENMRMTEKQAKYEYARRRKEEVWVNDLYQVSVDRDSDLNRTGTPCVHLSIKRRDKLSMHDWRHLQQIKNELVGPEVEAIEIYPAESRVVDTANQYHLWCFPGQHIPIGWGERLVVDNPGGGAVQRPRENA
jgi:hypothetical protein